jgi:pyruvate dehydrogenase E1 component alpha subunit
MAHNLLAKGAAYGIDSLKISEDEGLDILRLYDRFKPFVDECREKQRPGFVDLHTYRYQGHSMSDPQKYRTKEEVESVKARDSLDYLAAHLLKDRQSLSEDAFIAMQKDVKDTVAAAMRFAEESPAPDPAAELYSDVYVNIQKGLSPVREYVRGAKNPLL